MSKDNIFRQYPPLTAKMAPWMQALISRPFMLDNLLSEHGSPVNLHHLGPFARNYKQYKKVLEVHDLKHTLFFARKANKCRAFAKEASRLGFGVDTASQRELRQCLDLGCDPHQLVVTAAVKNEPLVRLAIKNEVLMVLDNEDECKLVNRVAGETGKTPFVGIRLSGFKVGEQKLYSRFGFDIEHVAEFITEFLGVDNAFNNLKFQGFHFHLDGYSVEQRAQAFFQTIKQVDKLQGENISTAFIDMGGGLLTNYLADKTEWETFWKELKKAVRGERMSLTFGNDGLGYEMVNGNLHGTANVYPYYNENPKEHFLEAVFSSTNAEGQTVASLLKERNIEFRMEPGRSLLDETGMTVAKVAHRKKDQRGDWLVGLEMNRSQLFSSSADFLVDPVLVPVQKAATEKPVAVYFTGGYCLESDIILKRKIVLPHLPEKGDIIVFPNTAGYMMHFYETESHLFRKAANVVAAGDASPRNNNNKSIFIKEPDEYT